MRCQTIFALEKQFLFSSFVVQQFHHLSISSSISSDFCRETIETDRAGDKNEKEKLIFFINKNVLLREIFGHSNPNMMN